MISFSHKGNFERTETFLQKISRGDIYRAVETYAQQGVTALAAATPVDSGKTKAGWGYKIKRSMFGLTITWTNSHVVAGTPLIILLQYGHGTGTGGYVQGVDHINPALRPIFNQIADNVWKAVNSA
jgi:hypothetical protein